jgi:hypothetical protein
VWFKLFWSRFMVFNATFNNISVILWQSVLLVDEYLEKTNHQLVSSHWQTRSHNVVSRRWSTNKHKLVINGYRKAMGQSWSWSYGSLIYNYLCNQFLSLLTLWVQIPPMARCSWYNIMWSSLSMTWDKLVVCFLQVFVNQ